MTRSLSPRKMPILKRYIHLVLASVYPVGASLSRYV